VFSRSHKVSLARNAAEAQQVLVQTRVDLVLLDVMMPGKDGLTLLKDMQSMYPEVPVIMVSASDVRPAGRGSDQGRPAIFVTKPFDVDQISADRCESPAAQRLQRNVEVLKTEVSTEYPSSKLSARPSRSTRPWNMPQSRRDGLDGPDLTAKPARARNLSRARSTPGAAAARNRSCQCTARPCRRRLWRANSSATRRAHSPVRIARNRADSISPGQARSFR